ncbi:hypothetical protein FS842_010763, partial [Serendipita sp. 407]
MPREDSIGSSGGSITSDEEEPIQNTTVHPTSSVVVTRPPGSDAASATVAGGTVRGPGIKRFQKTVRKVIQMNKIQSAFNPGGIGAEPGIDPRRPGSDAAYGHIKEPCEIEVIDYSATNYEIQQLDNTQFKAMMRATGGKRPPWAKVRWINVAGISWDVLSTLGITYNLHPLTLENILGGMKTARSKADYYTNHLFLHIMCQSLAEKESAASPLANVNPRRSSEHHAFRSKSPQQMTPEEEDAADEKNLRRRKRSQDVDVEKGISKSKGKGKTKDPKKKYRSPTEERRLETEERIKHTEEGNEKLRNNEYSVKVVTKGLFLYLLRDGTVISVHQADRGFGDPIYRRLQTPNTILRASADPSLLIEALLDLVVDRALDISKIYLADVHEHCEWILTSLEMFENISENLINYTFNAIAYETNNTMRTLTLATIVFLPLTFLSGYFGMNFATFTGVSAHSDAFFWEIAAPVFVVTVVVFLWHDLVRVWHYLRKKMFVKNIV